MKSYRNDTKYKAKSNYVTRKVANEFLLVSTENNNCFENNLMMLNETGYFIWNILDDYVTLTDVIKSVKKEFTDTNGVLEQEIEDFISLLVEMGLIEERS